MRSLDPPVQRVEELLPSLIAALDDGLFVCDTEHKVHYWSPLLESLLGIAPDQALGSSLDALLATLEGVNVAADLPRILEGETLITDKRFISIPVSRQSRWCVFKITPWINVAGDSLGMIGIVKDVSKQHAAEERLERFSADLREHRKLSASLERLILSFNLSSNPAVLLKLICQECSFLFEAKRIEIWIKRDGHLTNLTSFSSDEVPQAGDETTDLKAMALINQVARDRRPKRIDRPKYNGPSASSGGPLKRESAMMAIPLQNANPEQGVLFLQAKPHRSYQTKDLENALQLSAYLSIVIENLELFRNLKESSESIIRAYDTTLAGWARALELRDRETNGHTMRVTEATVELARIMQIGQDELVHIHRGALLHDIGKMGIPDAILRKPAELTVEEWEIMRSHPEYAYQWLSPIEYLRPALDIPHFHHEKWDGSGYPDGLRGTGIPLAARIFSIVDVWDALSSDRPYRKAWAPDRIREYLSQQSGISFDPEVVEMFLKFLPHIEAKTKAID
jgi:PAS domain S-box-containing protein